MVEVGVLRECLWCFVSYTPSSRGIDCSAARLVPGLGLPADHALVLSDQLSAVFTISNNYCKHCYQGDGGSCNHGVSGCARAKSNADPLVWDIATLG
jgi:hypothetical protein